MKSFKEYIKENTDFRHPSKDDFDRLDKHTDHLTAQHDLKNTLSDVEMQRAKNYTNSSFRLNRHLFYSHTDHEDYHDFYKTKYKDSDKHHMLNNMFKDQIKHLDSAIAKNKLKEPLTVHSGVKFNPGEEASKHPDRHVHLPAYTSTSLAKHTAHSFTNKIQTESNNYHSHVLDIHMNENHHALPILKHSDSPNEREVILPRNTTLKIADKPHTSISTYGAGVHHHTHFWDAHVVHQGEDHG